MARIYVLLPRLWTCRSIVIDATMTFIARRSVPLNKAPVFIERKDISLSNYSAGGVNAKEKRKKGKGLSFRNPIDPPPFRTMVTYGARGLRSDHKRVHPAEKRRYKFDGKRRGLRRRSRGVGPGALNPLLDILIRLSPGCSR